MIQHHNINDGEDHEPMPEHTPGPWTTARPDRDTVLACGNSKSCIKRICIADWRYDGDIDYPSKDEAMHNARLIAAAPELLKALEALLDAPECERLKCVSAEFVRAHDAADDAIRKAKGEDVNCFWQCSCGHRIKTQFDRCECGRKYE